MSDITQKSLDHYGFHKIIWNNVIPAYWLPLYKETGDYLRDRQFCIEVRFNEFRSDHPEKARVYLLVFSGIVPLEYIRMLAELLNLYAMLAGKQLE